MVFSLTGVLDDASWPNSLLIRSVSLSWLMRVCLFGKTLAWCCRVSQPASQSDLADRRLTGQELYANTGILLPILCYAIFSGNMTVLFSTWSQEAETKGLHHQANFAGMLSQRFQPLSSELCRLMARFDQGHIYEDVTPEWIAEVSEI